MPRKPFVRHSRAYQFFTEALWKTRTFLELGVVGIDQELDKMIKPIIAKFDDVKGVRGRIPKTHKPLIESSSLEGGGVALNLDLRSAFTLKQYIQSLRTKYDHLRYFFYGNLAVSLWAAFETYNALLFEQLLRERPEMLKSSESITIREVLDNQSELTDFLIERQLEAIGHLKLKEMIEHYKKRYGIVIPEARIKQLENYYLVRNLIAHKHGLVRGRQRPKLSAEVHLVGDEVRLSKTFVVRMATTFEGTVQAIERSVAEKYFARRANPSIERAATDKAVTRRPKGFLGPLLSASDIITPEHS